MSVKILQTAVVTDGQFPETAPLAQLLSISTVGNPAYLIVNALDRAEYTATGTAATGSFSGNGQTLGLQAIGSDARGAGIVYTWQASTGQYVNATYGSLSQLAFTTSSNQNDVTNISVFGTSNAALAQYYASSAYGLMQTDATGYVGSVTFASDPTSPELYGPENLGLNFWEMGLQSTQATPLGIAAAAMHFVGQTWNADGCWLLASTIAAEAGAGLPVQSTAIGLPGHANGEWAVIYNGPSSASANWQSLVSTGDIVAFAPNGGGGHITTCVSGNGSTAQLVDNIVYQSASGHILNSANDGSANDIVVAAPHAATQEFAGVSGQSVVIYALDTPTITDRASAAALSTGGTLGLAGLFNVADPLHKAITQYQVYDTSGTDSLMVSGHLDNATYIGDAVSTTSLSAVSLVAGSVASTDTLEVRASNGSYWGDWQSLAVTVSVPVPKAPVLSVQTANQVWKQGQAVNYVLSASTFKDPQNQALTYSVTGSRGASLPGWLNFNPATRAFTGTVPAGMAGFALTVTATDTAGLSASEHFSVTVPAAAPVLTAQTTAQSFITGSVVNLQLAPNTFTDPQGQSLTLKATLANGAALPSWLHFDAGSGVFSGTAPAVAQAMQVKVTATDTSGLSGYDVFSANVVHGTTGLMSAADWSQFSLGSPPASSAAPSGPVTVGGFRLPDPEVATAHAVQALMHHMGMTHGF